MLYSKCTLEEIREADNTDLIICLVRMNGGSRIYKYQLKTAKQIAEELNRRGIIDDEIFYDEYIEAVTKG